MLYRWCGRSRTTGAVFRGGLFRYGRTAHRLLMIESVDLDPEEVFDE
jgi:hypothetical protein